MFDHLADPNPPDLGESFRSRVIADGRRRQRRTRLSVGGAVLAPFVAVGGLAMYLRSQAGELQHIEVVGLVPADTGLGATEPVGSTTLPAVAPDDRTPEPLPLAHPLNILIAGVDRRPAGSDITGSRADTIAVVRIDPERNQVGILSIPRDLWVTSESGPERRINSFTEDGELVGVVSSLLDIDINHYVEVDFDGFESLIQIAGGVSVPFEFAVRDDNTGFSAEAGCNNLSGSDALAYVRSRKLRILDPTTGTWTMDPRSDLGRIERQQDLIERAYISVLSRDYGNVDVARLLNDVVDDLTTDTGLTIKGMLAIFNAAQIIGVDNFVSYDLTPGLTPTFTEDQSVLEVDPDTVETAVAALLGATPPNDDEGPLVQSSESIELLDIAC